jgi:hypothetical protein
MLLASRVLSPSAVRNEPKIHTSRTSELKSDKEDSVKHLFCNNPATHNEEDHDYSHFDLRPLGMHMAHTA